MRRRPCHGLDPVRRQKRRADRAASVNTRDTSRKFAVSISQKDRKAKRNQEKPSLEPETVLHSGRFPIAEPKSEIADRRHTRSKSCVVAVFGYFAAYDMDGDTVGEFADHAGFAKEQGFVDRSKKHGRVTHIVYHGPGWLVRAPAPRLRGTFCSHSSGDRGLLPCHHRGGPGWVRSQAPQLRRT